ncbi:MAG: hypothetical protein WBI63_06535 [Coriobacteriia bacterium]
MACTNSKGTAPQVSLRQYLAHLRDHAVKCQGVSAQTAQRAQDATWRHLLSRLDPSDLSARDRARVRAYFAAVVRRRAVSRPGQGDSEYRLRLRVATLADDLQRAGLDADVIRREAAEFFGVEALAFLPGAVA